MHTNEHMKLVFEFDAGYNLFLAAFGWLRSSVDHNKWQQITIENKIKCSDLSLRPTFFGEVKLSKIIIILFEHIYTQINILLQMSVRSADNHQLVINRFRWRLSPVHFMHLFFQSKIVALTYWMSSNRRFIWYIYEIIFIFSHFILNSISWFRNKYLNRKIFSVTLLKQFTSSAHHHCRRRRRRRHLLFFQF